MQAGDLCEQRDLGIGKIGLAPRSSASAASRPDCRRPKRSTTQEASKPALKMLLVTLLRTTALLERLPATDTIALGCCQRGGRSGPGVGTTAAVTAQFETTNACIMANSSQTGRCRAAA